MEYLKGSEISHADALRADALIIRTRTRCDGRLLDGTPVSYTHLDVYKRQVEEESP